MAPTRLGDMVAVHLKYSATAVPLRTRAVAQLAAKALHESASHLSVTEVAVETARLSGSTGISKKDAERSLQFLQSAGAAASDGDAWRLTSKGRNAIQGGLAHSRDRIDYILEAHFPASVRSLSLRQWFEQCCAEVFERFANYWARSICGLPTGGSLHAEELGAIMQRVAARHSMQGFESELSTGFDAFLRSPDPRDQEHLWALGQSLFAARLIAASAGADPLSAKEIRGALVFLDTNVLLALQVDGHKGAPEMAAFSTALSGLGVELVVLPQTRDEYDAVISGRREQTMNVVRNLPFSTVRKAKDVFTQSAVGRGCTTPEEFDTFFSEIGAVPSDVDGVEVRDVSDPAILESAASGMRDKVIQDEVRQAWEDMRKAKKSEHAIEHDAGLLAAVERARGAGRSAWVLTTDSTMCALAGRRAGPANHPTWIALDTVVQVLALDTDGLENEAANFGPLLSSILTNEAGPVLGTFTTEDLAWLLEIEERIAELPEDDLERCAMRVARARLSSRGPDDSELRLELQRVFQGRRLTSGEEIDNVRADLVAVREELDSERNIRETTENRIETLEDLNTRFAATNEALRSVLVAGKTAAIKRRSVFRLVFELAAAMVPAGGLIFVAVAIARDADDFWIGLGLPGVLLALAIGSVGGWAWKRVRRMRLKVHQARRQAEYEVLGA